MTWMRFQKSSFPEFRKTVNRKGPVVTRDGPLSVGYSGSIALCLSKVAIRALLLSTVIAFLIPSRYQSTANIMPPEQNDHGALLSMLAGKAGGADSVGSSGLASLAGSFLGGGSSGALFVELIHSRTIQERLCEQK